MKNKKNYFYLTVKMSFHQIKKQTGGSILGIFWLLLLPIFMLFVYFFAFSIVLRASYGSAIPKEYFILVLFSNLTLFNFFANIVNNSANLIQSNRELIKFMSFPKELIVFSLILSQFWQYLVSMLVFFLFYFFIVDVNYANLLFLPFLILPYFLFIAALSFLISAFGCYLKDIQQITPIIVTAFLFLSPIFYPLSRLPEEFRKIIQLSPIAQSIEWQKNLLFIHDGADYKIWLLYLFIAILFFIFSFKIFSYLKKGFSDVI